MIDCEFAVYLDRQTFASCSTDDACVDVVLARDLDYLTNIAVSRGQYDSRRSFREQQRGRRELPFEIYLTANCIPAIARETTLGNRNRQPSVRTIVGRFNKPGLNDLQTCFLNSPLEVEIELRHSPFSRTKHFQRVAACPQVIRRQAKQHDSAVLCLEPLSRDMA